MTDSARITAAAHEARRRHSLLAELRAQAPAYVEIRGLRIELARCTPAMRDALLAYTAPSVGGAKNPLAELEALEERIQAEAAARLSVAMLAARPRRDEDAIEDALASLRGHLEEHFTQRKYAVLYER